MKEKKGNKRVDTDIDMGGLDDFGDDLDFGEMEDIGNDRNANTATGISKELAKEAGKGFLSGTLKKSAQKALPSEYSDHYYEAMEYVDMAKETFDKNKSKINKSIFRLAKEVKKILPFQSKLLDSYLEKQSAEMEAFQQQTEEQIREAGIGSELSSIFDKQIELQKNIEVKRSAEAEVDRKQSLGLSKMNLDLLTSIDRNISTSTSFTLGITKDYYRKSLELQFKSHFVMTDMLKTMRDYYKGFSIQLDNVVKNTGLPDYVKLSTSESVKQIARQQFLQNTYKKMFSNSEYVQNVKKNFDRYISAKVDAVVSKIDAATDMASGIGQIGEMGGAGALAGALGGMIGEGGTEKSSNWLSGKIGNRFKDNKNVKTGANLLSMLAKAPTTFFGAAKGYAGRKKEEYSDEGTFGRTILSKLFGGMHDVLGVTDPTSMRASVKKTSVLSHKEPAIFDNNVHRSITEVIPMYLGRILTQNTNLTKMYNLIHSKQLATLDYEPAVDQVYDYNKRQLSSMDDFAKSTQALFNKDKGTKASDLTKTMTSLAKSSSELTKEEQKLLTSENASKNFAKYLHTASGKLKGENFNLDNVLEPKDADLAALVSNDPNLQKYLDTLKKAKLTSADKNINLAMQDINNEYPIKPIIELCRVASKLAGARFPNKITPEQANLIAKGFANYRIIRNSTVQMEHIASGQAFSFLSEAEIQSMKPVLFQLIGDVKTIIGSGDTYITSSLLVALSAVNSSIENNFEVNPEVFQTLYDYMPALQPDGELSAENLISGQLGIFKQTEENRADRDTIRELGRASNRKRKGEKLASDKTNVAAAIDNSAIVQNAVQLAGTFAKLKKGIQEAKSASEITSAIKSTYKDLKAQGKSIGKEAYSKAKDQLEKLSGSLDEASKKGAEHLKKTTLELLDGHLIAMKKAFELEKQKLKTEVEKLTDLRIQLADSVNDESTIRQMERDTEGFIKVREKEVKLIGDYITRLEAKRAAIAAYSTEGVKVTDFLGTIRTNVKSLLDEASAAMNAAD